MNWTRKILAISLVGCLIATPGFGKPTIVHDPIPMAQKSKPLVVRATVRDASARVESVALFYAASRGMTPFRAEMTLSGASVWYASIPGHLMGPGEQMLYYIQAENANGETKETDWITVKLVDAGVAPAAIPAASDVAQQAQQRAAPAPAPAPNPPEVKTERSKYLIPAAIIVGGGLAVGGALALANNSSGGGGGGGDPKEVNGIYGGTYSFCFEPGATTNATPAPTVCDSGLVTVYVTNGAAQVVGMWGGESFSGGLNGSLFSIVTDVSANTKFPASHIIVAGEISGTTCAMRMDGYSNDATRPGNYSGRFTTTKR